MAFHMKCCQLGFNLSQLSLVKSSSLINTSNTTLNVAYPNNKEYSYIWVHVPRINFGIHLKVLVIPTPNETDVVLLDDTNV
jgi:hypothetical protein